LCPSIDISFSTGGEAEFAPAARLARNLGEDRFIGLEYYSDFGRIGSFLPLPQQSQQLYAVTDFKVTAQNGQDQSYQAEIAALAASILQAVNALENESTTERSSSMKRTASHFARVNGGFRPDVVITDFRLPGENGFDVVRKVRGALGYAIPVIMMTGITDRQFARPTRACHGIKVNVE
jgi:CheY-like chemotaxis protein